jgi:hypothetical protein
VLFILYVVAEINKPKPVNWNVTISRTDKNPYGGFVLYRQLKHLFPHAAIQSFRTSVYQQINNANEVNTAYFIIGSALRPPATTTNEMKKYVHKGNYIVASANLFYTPFLDSFGLESSTPVSFKPNDSTSLNFVNPALKTSVNYTFLRATIDQYFSKIDTAKTIIISSNNNGKPVYVKIPYGKGAFFIHSAPLCFSNYFLLYRNNVAYTSKALSYIPQDLSKIYWDENYKLGPEGALTPLRFFLSNEYLRWSLRLSLLGLLLYVMFEMKRKQRIIPVITPLKNSTLDFIKTVAGVYYNERDNKGIADKKVNYFFEFIRNRFNVSTQVPDENFIEQLHKKSGIANGEIAALVHLVSSVSLHERVTDSMLLDLDRNIDKFYKQV